MYDPKFEKDVQQKMEELEFSPSEAVWTNIERAVNADKKRRRLPLFWMLFLSGILLLGAGIVYTTSRNAGTGVRVTDEKTGSAETNPPAATGTTAAIPVPDSRSTGKEGRVNKTGTIAAAVTAGNAIHGEIRRSGDAAKGAARTNGATSANDRKSANRATAANGGTSRNGGTSKNGGTSRNGGTSTNESTSLIDRTDRTYVTAGSAGADGPAVTAERPHDHRQPLASFRLPSPSITAARLPLPKSSGLTSLSKPKRPWEAAFTGGIGVSSFRQAAAHPTNASYNLASPVFSYFTIPGAYAYSNPAISKGGPSSIGAGPAFYAGVLARKPLSARWAITVGLDLGYNSSTIQTGPIVNGYAPSTLSLLNSAAAAPIQTYPYYVTGNQQVFTNRYYSLEVPATVQWQLNRSRTLPLFLESGLSFSYLVSSNALYYNSNAGVYFKDGDILNRARLTFTSSLMVGLPLGGINLQAGPQLEYGMSSLLKSSVTTGQHLFYGGLRLVIIPKGKK